MVAVVLIGHGAPATDCPPRLVGELMALEWGGDHGGSASGGALSERAKRLEAQIRDWPRRPGNDPYKVGLDRIAAELRRMLPAGLFGVGYNEFCRPSIPEVVEEMIGKGATRILVIPSMLTPGGLHSEMDIPRALQALRELHPAVVIEYVWPFDVKEVAALLFSHLGRALRSGIGGE